MFLQKTLFRPYLAIKHLPWQHLNKSENQKHEQKLLFTALNRLDRLCSCVFLETPFSQSLTSVSVLVSVSDLSDNRSDEADDGEHSPGSEVRERARPEPETKIKMSAAYYVLG